MICEKFDPMEYLDPSRLMAIGKADPAMKVFAGRFRPCDDEVLVTFTSRDRGASVHEYSVAIRREDVEDDNIRHIRALLDDALRAAEEHVGIRKPRSQMPIIEPMKLRAEAATADGSALDAVATRAGLDRYYREPDDDLRGRIFWGTYTAEEQRNAGRRFSRGQPYIAPPVARASSEALYARLHVPLPAYGSASFQALHDALDERDRDHITPERLALGLFATDARAVALVRRVAGPGALTAPEVIERAWTRPEGDERAWRAEAEERAEAALRWAKNA